jgi:hypothetical protein
MILKSFGCSFIFGTDLPDAVAIPGQVVVPSQQTWPAILAKNLNYQYECFARPGAGNLQIAEQALSQASTSLDSVFVISWSWIDRFDHWGQIEKRSNWINGNKWQTIVPTDTTQTAKIYYQNLHSEYRDKLTSLMSIKLVIDTLKQKNIPFIMTCMDELLFDQRWHITPAVIDLQEYVRPYIVSFEGQTFLDWSRANGYPISTTLHPLEAAHRAAGEYMIKVFDKQNIIDRWHLS